MLRWFLKSLLMLACLGADGSGVPGPLSFQVLSAGHGSLEGPTWDPITGTLFFTDQSKNELWNWRMETGAQLVKSFSGKVNGTTMDNEGNLLLCDSAERSIIRYALDQDGSILNEEIIVSGLPNEPNDLIVHSNGDIWFTTPYWGGNATRLAEQHIYRFIPESSQLSIVHTTTGKPNGLALSPDESMLFVCYYQADSIYKIELNSEGVPSGTPILFAGSLDKGPDGMKVDDQGNLYIVLTTGTKEGVLILNSDGDEIGIVRLPEATSFPTNLDFGNGKLYVTNGSILCAANWYGFPTTPQLSLKHTETQMEIDAQIEAEWIWAGRHRLLQPIRLFDMLDFSDLVPSQQDLSVEFRSLWSNDYLYFLFEVTDDNPQAPYTGTWFREDTVEIYLDVEGDSNGEYDGENDWEIGIHPIASPVAFVLGPNSIDSSEGFMAASKLTDKGYILELALPWSTLGLQRNAVSGHQFGLDVHVVDNDNQTGSREHKLAWHTWIDDSWKDTTYFGVSELIDVNVSRYWPEHWRVFGEPSPAGQWMYMPESEQTWFWFSDSFFPWVYHLDFGWSYLYPVPGEGPWAWSFGGPDAYSWVRWN